MKAFSRVVVRAVMLVFKVVRRACMLGVRTLFRSCGRNVIFDPFDRFSHGTISIGDDVYIGPGAIFLASESAIVIGRKVMFGPAVTIIGGDHNTSVVGA